MRSLVAATLASFVFLVACGNEGIPNEVRVQSETEATRLCEQAQDSWPEGQGTPINYTKDGEIILVCPKPPPGF